ncbi:MAG: hypothetical protein QW265_02765 [Candidatus Bathyarchaeia archaeon]
MIIEYGSFILGTIVGIAIGVVSAVILKTEKVSNECLRFNDLLNKLEELDTKIQEIESSNKSSKNLQSFDELKLELRILNEEVQKMLKKRFG